MKKIYIVINVTLREFGDILSLIRFLWNPHIFNKICIDDSINKDKYLGKFFLWTFYITFHGTNIFISKFIKNYLNVRRYLGQENIETLQIYMYV